MTPRLQGFPHPRNASSPSSPRGRTGRERRPRERRHGSGCARASPPRERGGSAERTPRPGVKTMGHCLPLAFRDGAALETPFVGHAELLAAFRELLVRTQGTAGRPCVVFGNAGHGKSRLLRELAALWPSTASVIALRCEPEAPFGRIGLGDQLRAALD